MGANGDAVLTGAKQGFLHQRPIAGMEATGDTGLVNKGHNQLFNGRVRIISFHRDRNLKVVA